MGTDNSSRHAEHLRQQRSQNSDSDRGSIFVIDRAAFNQGINAKYDISISEIGGGDQETYRHWSQGDHTLSAVGFDQHNLNVTGERSMTILNARADGHSVPVVFQPCYTLKIRGGGATLI